MRHLLGNQRLFADRRVGRAAAHRKVVADHDDRAAVDRGAAHHAIGRGQIDEPALDVVSRAAGYGADLVEAAAVDEAINALAHGELVGVVLPLDLVGAAELRREALALAQFVQFRLPAHYALRPSDASWP